MSHMLDKARRRLALLERHLDPHSQRRLTALGLGPDWHCLEVGAGGGSIARWMSEKVGPGGHVLATDLAPRFLEDFHAPNLTVWRHDILADDLPEARFDLVHARWLLHQLPQPEHVIDRLVRALRPAGWLLLEEVDFFPVHTSSSEVYVEFMTALSQTVVLASGRDCLWARSLPALVAARALVDIGGEGDVAVLQGGSPIAEFFQLTAEHVYPKLVASGALTVERFEAARRLLQDPAFWALAGAGIAVWGRRPYNAGRSRSNGQSAAGYSSERSLQ